MVAEVHNRYTQSVSERNECNSSNSWESFVIQSIEDKQQSFIPSWDKQLYIRASSLPPTQQSTPLLVGTEYLLRNQVNTMGLDAPSREAENDSVFVSYMPPDDQLSLVEFVQSLSYTVIVMLRCSRSLRQLTVFSLGCMLTFYSTFISYLKFGDLGMATSHKGIWQYFYRAACPLFTVFLLDCSSTDSHLPCDSLWMDQPTISFGTFTPSCSVWRLGGCNIIVYRLG